MSIPRPARLDGGREQLEFPSGSGVHCGETEIAFSAAWCWSASQARRDSFEILDTALAAVLHAVEVAIGRAEQLLRRIAVFGERGDARADRERRTLRLRRELFAHAGDDARRHVAARFGQHECEFVSAITRGCIDRARMIRK